MRTEVVRSQRRKKTVQAHIVDGVLRIHIPAHFDDATEAHWVDEMTARMQRTMATGSLNLDARAALLATRFGLPAPDEIRWSTRQRTLWGSCTPGQSTIRISDRLAEFPAWVVDYVIVHELAHLREPNHGAGFWALVGRYPKAERARGYLEAKADGCGHGTASNIKR